MLAVNTLTKSEQNLLVTSHRNMAYKIALRYYNLGLPIDELVSAAYLGLVIASRHYQPSYGFQFSTYADDWIHARIRIDLHKKYRAGFTRIPRGGAVPRVSKQVDTAEDDTYTCLDTLEHEEAWTKIMTHLPEKWHRVAHMRYVLDMNFTEIGLALGCTKQNAQQIDSSIRKCLLAKIRSGQVDLGVASWTSPRR